VVLDADGACAAMSVFHVNEDVLGRVATAAAGAADRKHVVTLLDPTLKIITCLLPPGAAGAGAASSAAAAATPAGAAASFPCLQVLSPDAFFVDGRAVNKETTARASSVSIEAFDR
jgi:hypothetical protein